MGHYKYYITFEQDGYKFGLYPNNNNRQWVVISNGFKSIQETKVAMKKFKNEVVSLGENAFTIEKIDIGRYKLSFIDEHVNVSYILKNRTLCQKKMERIINNVTAPLEVRDY